MEIFTLNVGQGQFVVVAGKKEAFIVDTFVPLSSGQNTVFVKAALSSILDGRELTGLVVTGFDADHFCEAGMKLVLNKYRPNWLMYPNYCKRTPTADRCFDAIQILDQQKDLQHYPMALGDNNKRLYGRLCAEFSFEIFSPHRDDMNSSNNCSIVCKVTEKATGGTYLITGDTEVDRWDSIVRYFGRSLQSHVLAAPHHGSENGISAAALSCIGPHTILVSAGVQSQYGHPHSAAQRLFRDQADHWYATNTGQGQSIRTVVDSTGVNSFKFKQ
jgi:beta-lactamase superfamily II metal-dependent hydrolase